MADNDLTDDELAIFFEEAGAQSVPGIPSDLVERVLADAAEIGAGYAAPVDVEPIEQRPNWLGRLLSPIGGMGGAFALGAFASIGLVVGLGDAETLYSLPVMGDILAVFSDEFGDFTPIDTLDYLMAES